jgi:hypothetical protein
MPVAPDCRFTFCLSLAVEEIPRWSSSKNPHRHPQSQPQSSIAHRCRLVVLDLDRMFPLPLGVVICNLRKPMPQLARPHQTSCLNGMELSTGVGWFTYVIISSDVAHSFSLFYSLARTLVALPICRLFRWSSPIRIAIPLAGRLPKIAIVIPNPQSKSTTLAGRHIGSPSR